MRLLMPLLLILLAIGLFVVYTNPTYQNIKALGVQSASYDDAISKSQQLQAIRDQLLAKRNSFDPQNVSDLEQVLPDNVDNIRLIIDINNIAARHNLSLSNVALDSVSGSDSSGSSGTQAAAVSGSQTGVGSVDLGFAVDADYPDFLAFTQDLEHSLRLIDIEKIGFAAGQGNLNTYTFSIRTYWLH